VELFFPPQNIGGECARSLLRVSDDGCALQRVTLRAATQKVTRAPQNERHKKRTQLIKLKVVTESGNRAFRDLDEFSCLLATRLKVLCFSLIGRFGARAHELLIVTIYYDYKILLRRSEKYIFIGFARVCREIPQREKRNFHNFDCEHHCERKKC
jgi:hypothetical protein